MRILFVATEAVPFCKTGGLGDVIGSLPLALQAEKHNVAVILPLYQDIPLHFREAMEQVAEVTVPLGWRKQHCGIKRLLTKGVTFYFVENEYYFARTGLYGHFDDAERFAFFSRAVLQALPLLEFKPDLLHCHDWQTGVVSLFLHAFYQQDPYYQGLKTVYTIHNLKYQGIFSEFILGDILGLGREYFTVERLEFFGQVNFMKTGIVFSDAVTTVSRSYAEEIKDPYYGEGLDSLLQEKAGKLQGIVNGLDYVDYNPLTDRALAVNYRSSLEKKRLNKVQLQETLGLTVEPQTPLLALVTRLVQQKGLDLIAYILEELMQQEVQLVVLGTGEARYQELFQQLAVRYPQKLSVTIGFDESLARQIYAASDIYLMPSQFEPCGISQLIALRYGSVPVVRETGGLKDTIIPYNEYTWEGNGFGFQNYNAHELLDTVYRALKYYHQPEQWAQIVQNALLSDFSWLHSAQEYTDLYTSLVGEQRAKDEQVQE